MHPLVYVMLVAWSAHAHAHSDDALPDSRDIRCSLANGTEIVECYPCRNNTSSWQVNNEVCPLLRFGKRFKTCVYAAFDNPACGNRRDCYQGLGERCVLGVTRCALHTYCDPTYTGGACASIYHSDTWRSVDPQAVITNDAVTTN